MGSAIATVTGLPMGALTCAQKVTAREASMRHWKGQYPWPFGRDPNPLVLRHDNESDRLIGYVSVTYVTLVP